MTWTSTRGCHVLLSNGNCISCFFFNDTATTEIYTLSLHDALPISTYKTVQKEFGKEVADLVDGVTKISALEGKVIGNSKAENIRKLILATSKDIRVLLVKLADRLHNMRTLNSI